MTTHETLQSMHSIMTLSTVDRGAAVEGGEGAVEGCSRGGWGVAVQGGHSRLLTGGIGDREQGRLSRAGKATFSLQA